MSKTIYNLKNILLFALLSSFIFSFVYAGGGEGASHASGAALNFLWIAIILIAAKVSGLVEKFGQPSVLGELVIGVVLGNLGLIGFHLFDPIKTNEIITFLAELGVVILLFQVGLESNIKEMSRVGYRAFSVAIIGVIVPFVLGTYLVGPWLLPGLSSNAYLFLGAALTATSVGITARVFKDLKKLKTSEAKIVLGAAVIDDVLGLIILAVVSAIATVGSVSFLEISKIIGIALAFLIGAIIFGQLLARAFGRLFASISTSTGMKLTLALSFALIFSYLAQLIGLAPIVGAFAAGLVLDPVHFKRFKNSTAIEDIAEQLVGTTAMSKQEVVDALNHHKHRHVEDLVEPLSQFLVPIFFVFTGMTVDLTTLFDPVILIVALAITLVAIIGKIVAGLVAGPVKKWLVGWGMVPRGEVGLIFASIGLGLGVISPEVFSIIVIMVIVTTLITPPILSYLLRR